MTFDLSQILAAVFGGGLIVTALKLWAARRQASAQTAKTIEETEAIHLSNDSHRLADIGISNKTIKDLLAEAEANIKKMRETNSQLVAAQTENSFLSTSLSNAKAIIDYQKTERHEWTMQLAGVLQELAETKAEVEQLRQRVGELETINVDLQHTPKAVHIEDPLKVRVVDAKGNDK